MTSADQAAALRCATAARARLDPLPGTAAPARRWLLVEYPGPWAVQALDSALLPRALSTRLHEAARAVSGRVLLTRRPGRRAPAGVRSWAVVDHTGGQRWGRWEVAADLDAAVDALAAPDAGGPGEPLLLVCAHGVHDACCAVRGRPVARALADHWPNATWECSHLGGDRFAANLLVVPDGACYGNLTPQSAVDVVRAHLAGTVSPEHLRGLSTEPPVVQAAIVAAHATLGPAAAGDLVGLSARRAGPETWLVRLAGSGVMPAVVEATVSRSRRPPARLTCRAAGESAAYGYDVLDLRAAPATR